VKEALQSRFPFAASVPSPRVVLLGTGWLFLLFMGGYVIAPASLLPRVMADLGAGEGAGAALISMPQVAATLLGLPVGIYLDRIESRAAVPGAAGLLFLGSAVDWVAATGGNYPLLVASRLVAGVGMFVLWVVGTNAVSSAFPPDRRATATSVFITGYPAGYAFGQVAAPLVAGVVGWPGVFPVFGGAVLAMSLAFYLVAGRVTTFDAGTATPEGIDFKRVLTNRNVWGVATLSFLGYSLYMLFNSWMPTYMSRQFGISLVESGLFVALFPAVGLLSRPAGGWLSDGPFGRRRRPVFVVSFVGAMALAVAMRYSTTIPLLVAGLAVSGFFIQLQIGLLYQYVQEFVEANVAGTAISLVSVTGWLGSFVAPVVVGELIALSGGFVVIFGFALAVGAAGLVTTWLTDESTGPAAAAA